MHASLSLRVQSSQVGSRSTVDSHELTSIPSAVGFLSPTPQPAAAVAAGLRVAAAGGGSSGLGVLRWVSRCLR
eukprot:COSAG06_NODE_7486_length_2489_cov_1.864017_2_plen_73_part_00